MPIPTEEELIAAACHFGHLKQKWNPKIAPFLYGVRKGMHIFDITQTRSHVESVCRELAELQKAGKVILFVSTKQQAIPLIEEMGRATGQLTVTKKWIPGLLTNWGTMRKRLQYYIDLQNSFQTGEVEKYTKKEQTQLRKELAKLDA
ncbi:30S ribosomal protein S2, partial [Candidatus Peregrinibacteria bacterium]|nr:30S ribosomal protein S2 [Candidatus Peregrinibacteria bacterium]